MTNYQPAFDPNWTDLHELLVLSDAEEEQGNIEAAETLRWIVLERKLPYRSLTYRMDGKMHVSYDWRRFYSHRRGSCVVPSELLKHIDQPEDVDIEQYTQDYSESWRAFWSIESAYIALITVCINHYDIFRTVTNQ